MIQEDKEAKIKEIRKIRYTCEYINKLVSQFQTRQMPLAKILSRVSNGKDLHNAIDCNNKTVNDELGKISEFTKSTIQAIVDSKIDPEYITIEKKVNLGINEYIEPEEQFNTMPASSSFKPKKQTKQQDFHFGIITRS